MADIDFPAQNLMDVESVEQWLKQYNYEVFINPTESPLQVKNYLLYANRMVLSFNCVVALISKVDLTCMLTCIVSIDTYEKGSSILSLMVITSCVRIGPNPLMLIDLPGFFIVIV